MQTVQMTMNEVKSLKPKDAHAALRANASAVLIDVRDVLEYAYVGHPVGAVNIPSKQWCDRQWRTNPDFVSQVTERVPDKATPLFVLCRSGQRSLEAAKTLLAAGYQDVTNIEEGFEGALDGNKHRSTLGGWRYHGLPWEQS